VNARTGRVFTRKADGKTGYLLDAETLQAAYEIQEENYVNECSFSADGTRLLVVTGPWLSQKPRSFHVYEVESGREVVSVDLGTTYEPDNSAISADGSLVAILHTITTVDVYRVADGRRIGSFEIPSFETEDGMQRGSATDAFAINPNGSQVMSSGNQTTLWNSPDFETFFRLRGRFRAFDGSGDRVLTSKDNQVLLWDCAKGRLRATFQGNSEPVTLASVSQDGHRAVTGAQGGSAWVWDTETGSLITELAGHVYKNTTCGFTTDNRLSVTASHDGTAQVWDIAPLLTDADLLTPIVEILTGTTIGGNGELQSLPLEDLSQRRKDVTTQMEEAMRKTPNTARLELAGLILRVDPRNEPALEAIVSTLSNPDSRDRFAAARALQNLGPGGQNAVAKLEPLFRHGDSLSASAAGMALFRMRGRSTGVLIDGLKSERQVTSRLAAHLVKLSGILAKDAIPDLIESLGSGDAQVARDVSQALVRMGPAAIPALNVALEQPNESIRRRAAVVLELLGQVGEASIPRLVEALGAPDRPTRVEAGESLIKIGEEAVGPVTSALRHEHWLVRYNAAFVLGELETKAPETTKALIEGMLTDDNERVRANCLNALKDIYLFGGNPVIPQLVDRFESEKDGDVHDRIVAAVMSLGSSEDVAKLGAGAVPFLVKEIQWSPPEGKELDEEDIDGLTYGSWGADVKRRQDAASALQALGPDAVDAVPAMIEALLDEQNWDIRDAIIAVGEPAFPHLVKALSDRRPLMRAAVVKLFDEDEFSKLAPTAIPSLLQNLKDDSGLVRVETAEVLLSLRQDPQTLVPVLHEQLEQSSSAARRKKSAELLAKIGRPADVTLPTLEKLFEDPDDAVRFANAEAWVAIKNEIELRADAFMLNFDLARAIDKLVEDGKSAVTIHPKIFPTISNILCKEKDDSLRMAVVTFVEGFGAQAKPWIPALIQCALTDYDSDREDFNVNLRSSATEALAKIGAVEALVEILSDHESEIDNKRDDAASALKKNAKLHDRAVPLVAKLLTHPHEGVRESAVEVLAGIGAASAPALPALEEAKNDVTPDVRIAAAKAIKAIREAIGE
jgi:HEAT repeat protein